MSLDISLTAVVETEVFDCNITNNLIDMAKEAQIFECIWLPGDLKIQSAKELVAPLSAAVKRMKDDPERFKVFNPPNGWGAYDSFLSFVERYLEACIQYPDATIRARS